MSESKLEMVIGASVITCRDIRTALIEAHDKASPGEAAGLAEAVRIVSYLEEGSTALLIAHAGREALARVDQVYAEDE